jgi:hypothetical protein
MYSYNTSVLVTAVSTAYLQSNLPSVWAERDLRLLAEKRSKRG